MSWVSCEYESINAGKCTFVIRIFIFAKFSRYSLSISYSLRIRSYIRYSFEGLGFACFWRGGTFFYGSKSVWKAGWASVFSAMADTAKAQEFPNPEFKSVGVGVPLVE